MIGDRVDAANWPARAFPDLFAAGAARIRRRPRRIRRDLRTRLDRHRAANRALDRGDFWPE